MNHRFINKIEEYEEVCPECKGWGKSDYHGCDSSSSIYTQCEICKGRGKIDWIDKIKNGTKRRSRWGV